MTRKNYAMELEELHAEIIKMGNMVETAIDESIKAFKNNDLELCQEIIEHDKIVDDLEKTIESKCLWLIAREQPVASDLRKITTGLKMITDMERVADAAADIAELAMRIDEKNSFANSGHIPQMSKVAISMVHDAVNSYINKDIVLAQKTEKRDDEVDDYFNLIKEEMAQVFRAGDAETDNAVDLLLIAKYLERIADHAVNICEWVEFSVTGIHKSTKIF